MNKLNARTFLALMAFLLPHAVATQNLFSSASAVEELFTDEEKVVAAAMRDEYAKMAPRAYIVRGTLLYLMHPYKLKYYNINSLGFRGEEAGPKKVNGFNVLVLGGSTVFGDASKADYQTIPALLKGLLQEKHPGRDIQVYNLGIPGYTFQREAALAKRLRKKLSPDLVIFYHIGNDLTIAYPGGYIRFRPFDKDEETFFVKKQLEHNWEEAIKGLVKNAKDRIRGKSADTSHLMKISEKADSVAKGYVQDARDVSAYFNGGGGFRAENIPVLFVIQPTVFTRKSRTPREQKIVDTCKRPGYEDYVGQCVEKIKRSSQSEGIEVRDFTGAFDEYKGELFMDEVHVNVAGNRIIAERLAELVEEAGYLNAVKR